MDAIFEKGIIDAFNVRKRWGFCKQADGTCIFFHLANSPGFVPELGMKVEFQLAPPFRFGQADQAVNLRRAQTAQKVSETAATSKVGV